MEANLSNKITSRQKLALLSGLVGLLVGLLFTGFFFDRSLAYFSRSSHQMSSIVFFSFCLAATIFHLSSMSSKNASDKKSDYSLSICIFYTLIIGLELTHSTLPIDRNSYFIIFFVSNLAIIYNGINLALILIGISQIWQKKITLYYCAIIFFIGLLARFEENFITEQQSIGIIAIIRHILFFCTPFVVAGLTAVESSFQLSHGNTKESLRERFQWHRKKTDGMKAFFGFVGANLAMFFIDILSLATAEKGISSENSHFYVPFHAIGLDLFPLIFLSFKRFGHQNRKNNHKVSALSGFSTPKEQRFFERHGKSSSQPWAATVGMRTTNFMINHDPNSLAANSLPITLSNIRHVEFKLFIEFVLGTKLLHYRDFGSKIFGSIDPEYSCRTCIDSLTLLCCIYSEAFPLIEGRLKNLSSLFPIIDPDMSHSITPKSIEEFLAKIECIFYLDFNWVDQQMIADPVKTSYGVSFENLNSGYETLVRADLLKNNRVGNFIWISESARNRILMEAPYLTSIIDKWNMIDGERNKETSIYLIKFEELIPRMQKYYDLEHFRKQLAEFEPSIESKRILRIKELELLNTKSPFEIIDIISSIAEYRWTGFKEKNMALSMITSASESLSDWFSKREYSASFQDHTRKILISAIEKVGSPSQLLHQAHVNKIRRRKANVITETGGDFEHPRFQEAWIILATAKMENYSQDDLECFFDLISLGMKNSRLRNKDVVRQKLIEAFFNVSQSMDKKYYHIIEERMNDLVLFLIQINAPPDICCFFLDAKLCLEEQNKCVLNLTSASIKKLGKYFNSLYSYYGSKSSQVLSLSSRWKVLYRGDQKNSQAS